MICTHTVIGFDLATKLGERHRQHFFIFTGKLEILVERMNCFRQLQ